MTLPQRLDGHALPDLPDSHYLDNRIYTDQSIFENEQKNILSCSWRFACHVSEIKQKFDYRLVNIAGHELVLIRGKDNTIRGFYNSCAHRGARIVRTPAGNLDEGRMTCFYHLWTYDAKGKCTTVTQPQGYKQTSVKKESTSLKSVRVDIIFGLVFVCLDDAVESLPDFLGEKVIDAMRIPFERADLEVFHFHRTEIQANWKLFVETNCEGYHELLHLLNRTTAVAEQKYRSRQWSLYRNGHISFDPAKIEYGNIDYDKRDANLLPGMEPNGHVVVNLFPDMMLNCRSTVVRLDSLIPIANDKTILECRGLGLVGDSEKERAMRINHHNQVWGPAGVNLAEDLWAVETQMQNMINDNSRYSVIAREEQGAMSDSSLRHFYSEWNNLTGKKAHCLDDSRVDT